MDLLDVYVMYENPGMLYDQYADFIDVTHWRVPRGSKYRIRIINRNRVPMLIRLTLDELELLGTVDQNGVLTSDAYPFNHDVDFKVETPCYLSEQGYGFNIMGLISSKSIK